MAKEEDSTGFFTHVEMKRSDGPVIELAAYWVGEGPWTMQCYGETGLRVLRPADEPVTVEAPR